MTPTVPGTDASPDLDHALCIKCGYALAGLQESGVCPECGHAVWASIQALWLDEAPQAERRTMRRRMVLVGYGPLVMGAVFWFGAGVSCGGKQAYTNSPSDWLHRLFWFCTVIGMAAWWLRACFLISQQQIAAKGDRSLAMRCVFHRSTSVAFVIAVLTTAVIVFVPVPGGAARQWVLAWLGAIAKPLAGCLACSIAWQVQDIERRFKRPVAERTLRIAVQCGVLAIALGLLSILMEIDSKLGLVGQPGARSDLPGMSALVASFVSWLLAMIAVGQMNERLASPRRLP